MAAKTGSTYISGTMIDSIEIFNYDKFKKVLPDDRDNDQLRYSITVLFSVTHCRCTCTYAIKQMRKRHFCSFVTVTNMPTKTKSVNITVILCQCMGVFYHQIFTVSPEL